MIDNILKLQSLFSVAGYENKLTEYIVNELKDSFDECYVDKIGNVICHKKGKGDKILINVPVSGDGVFINHISSDGKAKFKSIGNIKPEKITGKSLRDEKGEVIGVIYSEQEDSTDSDNLYIDFGVFGKEDAPVNIGDVLELCPDNIKVGKNIYGTNISRCANISAHISVAKAVKTGYDLYYAFSVMDNIGFKGAKTAAFSINPDLCITSSVSFADEKESTIELTKGAVIRIKDSHIIVNKNLRDMLIKKLQEKGIPYQLEVLSKEGLTNNEIMYLGNGILTANINLAAKGKGEVTECVNTDDLENFKKSIEEILR